MFKARRRSASHRKNAKAAWWIKMKNKKKYSLNFVIGAVITGAMILLIIIGFLYTPYDISKMDGTAKFAAPSLKHLMGAITLEEIYFQGCLRAWEIHL